MRRAGRISGTALGLLLLLSACAGGGGATGDGTDAGTPECTARADCAGGLVCREGACTACQVDAECEGNELCHPLRGACEFLPCHGNDCARHDDCDLGAFCVQGLCRRPGDALEGDCPAVTPCGSDAECAEGLSCNPDTLVCEAPVACTSDAACPAGAYCDRALGTCAQSCTRENAADTCPERFVCDSGRCVECTTDADCGAGLACDAEVGRCAGTASCFTDRDCPRPLVCNRRTRECTEAPPPCLSNEDCGTGEACELSTGACVSAACGADALEPNDAAETAAAVEPGFLSNLTLCDGEDDWYRLALSGGDRVAVGVTPPNLSTAGYSVGLWNPAADRLLAQGNLGVDHTVADDGDYRLRVRTEDPRSSYEMQILVARGVPCEDDGYEENDAFTEAAELAEGTFFNLWKCPGDADWFVLPVPRGAGVRVSLLHDPLAGDLDLVVRDADGVTVLGESAGTDPTERVELATTDGGRVLLEVRAAERTRNAYDLEVEVRP